MYCKWLEFLAQGALIRGRVNLIPSHFWQYCPSDRTRSCAFLAQWASPYYIALGKWKRHLLAALAVSCTMLSPLGHFSVNEDAPRVLEGPQDQPSFIDWALSKKSFCQPPGIEFWSSAWLTSPLTIVPPKRWKLRAKNNRSLSIFFFKILAQKHILAFLVRLGDLKDCFFYQERSLCWLFVIHIVE